MHATLEAAAFSQCLESRSTGVFSNKVVIRRYMYSAQSFAVNRNKYHVKVYLSDLQTRTPAAIPAAAADCSF